METKGLLLGVSRWQRLRAVFARTSEACPVARARRWETVSQPQLSGLSWPPRILAVAAFGLMTSACVPEAEAPKLQPPPGSSAKVALEEFIIAAATAKVIGETCTGYGIQKGFNNSRSLSAQYVGAMRQQGYSEAEMKRAVDRISAWETTERAFERLTAAGVKDGDVASLCRYGKREIAKGSAIGKLLRLKA